MNALRLDAVTMRFGDLVANDRVDLSVDAGEVVGLLGANGAGKTTAIRVLLGLLRPTAGSATQFGEAPSRSTRRRVGYVPQSLGLWSDLTVDENLRFAAAAFKVEPVATEPELLTVRSSLVGDLPLGLRRRVAFAVALQHAPQMLVLDEPTSGVDPLGRAALWDRIREQAESGVGVLVSTHSMDEAAQCDRLVILARGRVVASGPERDIVGGDRAVEVSDTDWRSAFEALEDAGIPAGLLGRRVRVPGGDRHQVESALAAAGVRARLETVPATLEETMVTIAAES